MIEISKQQRIIQIINKISILKTYDQGYKLISKAVETSDKPIIISFINAHGFNLSLSDYNFYNNLINSDFLFRDGIGMKILFKMYGVYPGLNVCGTDFIPYLINQMHQKKIALLGTKQPYLSNAINHKNFKKHEIILIQNGFLKATDYVPLLSKTTTEVILLGMGMPKQEELSNLLKNTFKYNQLIINGGAIIDFMGGRVPRAPQILRFIGLEWLFRLMFEPRRLFKRYIIGNIVFLYHITKFNLKLNNKFIQSSKIKNLIF